jgi:hypothetical protein
MHGTLVATTAHLRADQPHDSGPLLHARVDNGGTATLRAYPRGTDREREDRSRCDGASPLHRRDRSPASRECQHESAEISMKEDQPESGSADAVRTPLTPGRDADQADLVCGADELTRAETGSATARAAPTSADQACSRARGFAARVLRDKRRT